MKAKGYKTRVTYALKSVEGAEHNSWKTCIEVKRAGGKPVLMCRVNNVGREAEASCLRMFAEQLMEAATSMDGSDWGLLAYEGEERRGKLYELTMKRNPQALAL